MRVVDRALFAGPTLDAARAVLGARLVRDPGSAAGTTDHGPFTSFAERRVGRIVEVEAYLGPEDEASHARFGPTTRTSVMFGPPGVAYVYLVYGMYDALNIVTGPDGQAGALLVRAVEPLEGFDSMRAARLSHVLARRRGDDAWRAIEAERLRRLPTTRLASGPGLVAAAFGIGRTFSGRDMCDPRSPLRLEEAPEGEVFDHLVVGPRVGIRYAGEPWRSAPWRVAIAGNPAVSRPTPTSPGVRAGVARR